MLYLHLPLRLPPGVCLLVASLVIRDQPTTPALRPSPIIIPSPVDRFSSLGLLDRCIRRRLQTIVHRSVRRCPQAFVRRAIAAASRAHPSLRNHRLQARACRIIRRGLQALVHRLSRRARSPAPRPIRRVIQALVHRAIRRCLPAIAYEVHPQPRSFVRIPDTRRCPSDSFPQDE